MEMEEEPLVVARDEMETNLDEGCEDLSMEEDHNLEEVVEPKIGMSFDSEIEAREYYASYGRRQGFGVIIRTSKEA